MCLHFSLLCRLQYHPLSCFVIICSHFQYHLFWAYQSTCYTETNELQISNVISPTIDILFCFLLWFEKYNDMLGRCCIAAVIAQNLVIAAYFFMALAEVELWKVRLVRYSSFLRAYQAPNCIRRLLCWLWFSNFFICIPPIMQSLNCHLWSFIWLEMSRKHFRFSSYCADYGPAKSTVSALRQWVSWTPDMSCETSIEYLWLIL